VDICCCHILIVDRHPVLIDNDHCPAATLEKGWFSRKKMEAILAASSFSLGGSHYKAVLFYFHGRSPSLTFFTTK